VRELRSDIEATQLIDREQDRRIWYHDGVLTVLVVLQTATFLLILGLYLKG
jgi:hypothetical protein